MERLTPERLDADPDRVDALVASAPGIDRFCTATPWSLSAHETLMPPRTLWAWEGEAGVVLLARGRDARHGHYLQPLEAVWGFAAPAAGPDPEALGRALAGLLRDREDEWSLLILSGIVQGGPLFRHLVSTLAGRYRLGLAPTTLRRTADLTGGVDGFLSRRSPRFRANVRRAVRRAGDAGVAYEPMGGDPERLLSRVLTVERLSWKGPALAGMNVPGMRDFYRRMIPRLQRRRALRGLFVTLDGQDLAYAFGGLFGTTYRGLQTSYVDPAPIDSPGAVAQMALIERLCAEGIQAFDMGQDIDYKRRWTEPGLETTTLLVAR